jgi:hypothetical protein
MAQNMDAYTKKTQEAYKLYLAKDYLNAANTYKDAFDELDRKAYPQHRYSAACAYARANMPDSSFYHLFRLANASSFANYDYLIVDSSYFNLHKDPRWEEVTALVKANKEENEKDLDKPLIKQLDRIYFSDQTYRKQLDSIEEKHGANSPEIKAHWKVIQENDSLNLIQVENTLDTRGWLGRDVIGYRGNSTLFLVIQHSNTETQVKYLPMMKEAVKNGNASASSLALLEDRVALAQGKRQIYGSQIGRDKKTNAYYVSPLIDPENVDKRRAEVGLPHISEYVKNWKMTWDLEKHKAHTKKIEEVKK